jgi:hypothetical protein
MRTIKVKTGGGIRKVSRYSKLGDLVISREPDPKYPLKYNITHMASTMSVCRFHKLADARKVLKVILPLTDWKQSADRLEYDTILLGQIRDAIAPFNGEVQVRRG